MRRTLHPHAKVYVSVRSAHLERARASPHASILHRHWRYDNDLSLAVGLDVIQGSTASLVVTLLRSDVELVEVNEPLMRPGLYTTAAAVIAVRVRGWLRARRVVVVSYAIENRDGFAAHPSGWRALVRHRVELLLSRYVASQLDRLCCGTQAAEDLYRQVLPGRLSAETTVVPALPAPCRCGTGDDESGQWEVLFLGALAARKGFPELAAAWPEILRQEPQAQLTLVGQGPLEDQARSLASTHPGVSLVVAPPRDAVHRHLRRASVLVLLSQRTNWWREQVGLPLVEGLAHGCAVVTTTETGLAGWLAAAGHHVLPATSGPGDVAHAVVAALRARRPRADVLAQLPDRDGRLAADEWMMRPSSATQS